MNAEQLILAYYDAVLRSREPLLECSAPDEFEHGTCYYDWRNNRSTASILKPTTGEMVDWCPECRANEERIKRKRAATRQRGALLRAMQQYAKRMRAAAPPPEPGHE